MEKELLRHLKEFGANGDKFADFMGANITTGVKNAKVKKIVLGGSSISDKIEKPEPEKPYILRG